MSVQSPASLLAYMLWMAAAFLLGAMPFSLWLGRYGLGVDIRRFGDGNPGAANVWRAGGPYWGAAAVLLDFSKSALPVGVANYVFGVRGWLLAAIALAPVLGHAFSPFLRFQGGKALAVTFGMWAGLTAWQVPLILGLFFGLWLRLLRVEGRAVLAGMACLGAVFLAMSAGPVLWLAWAGNALVLIWKHRADFGRLP